MAGELSEGMLLDLGYADGITPVLAIPEKPVPDGTRAGWKGGRLKDAKEINQEVRAIKERAKALSGFWIGELAAAIYALEWAADKRDDPPSAVLGGAGGGHEKIAGNLMKLVEQQKRPAKSAMKLVKQERAGKSAAPRRPTKRK
jgi:hypothetical protein